MYRRSNVHPVRHVLCPILQQLVVAAPICYCMEASIGSGKDKYVAIVQDTSQSGGFEDKLFVGQWHHRVMCSFVGHPSRNAYIYDAYCTATARHSLAGGIVTLSQLKCSAPASFCNAPCCLNSEMTTPAYSTPIHSARGLLQIHHEKYLWIPTRDYYCDNRNLPPLDLSAPPQTLLYL